MSEAVAGSNSLPDLAARIRAAHAAVGDALKHAIVAGDLLIEAKSQVPHGEWLPWLEANCEMSERTAQVYMRLARELGKLEPAKAQRVADLSVRDALQAVSRAASVTKLSPQSFDAALTAAEADDHVTFQHHIKAAQRQAVLDAHALLPTALAPSSPHGRSVRVAHNRAKRQWRLAIGPNAAGMSLKQDLEAADTDPAVVMLRQEQDERIAEAEALEAEAKALRKDADDLQQAIRAKKLALVKAERGTAHPFIETYDFESADETTERALLALTPDEIRAWLLDARGRRDGALKEIERGYWGDIVLMDVAWPHPGPGEWTKFGSPEWLGKLFGPQK